MEPDGIERQYLGAEQNRLGGRIVALALDLNQGERGSLLPGHQERQMPGQGDA